MRIPLTAAAAALALAACDGATDAPSATPSPSTATKPKPRPDIDKPVEDAMMRIPPGLRSAYQQAFVCEVKRATSRKQAVKVTAGYVRDLTRRLQADPEVADC